MKWAISAVTDRLKVWRDPVGRSIIAAAIFKPWPVPRRPRYPPRPRASGIQFGFWCVRPERECIMKRQLSDAEKSAIVERQRALILASRPNAIVSVHVDDETDDNGNPISQITIQEERER